MGNHVSTPAFRDVDIPLKDDVRMLGEILGHVIREQAGEELFDLVERARLSARAWRAGQPDAAAQLEAELSGLPTQVASELTRAFSEYFGVVNMAEQVHRIRRHLQRAAEASGPQPGSLEAVLVSLAAQGVSWETVHSTLQNLRVAPVFTAHPTRAIRRSLLAKEQRIARALVDRMQASALIPVEEAANIARLQTEIAAAWQTEENLRARPTVADEAEYVLFYLTDVVVRIVPPFYQALREAVRAAYGDQAAEAPQPPILDFGSWVGGDMDGNPNVGAETIAGTIAQHRTLILRRYHDDIRQLADHLSQSTSRVGVNQDVLDRLASYCHLLPHAAAQVTDRYADMPYRSLLLLMAARVQKTLDGASEGYSGAAELETDVAAMLASMQAHRGMGAGGHLLLRLLWRVQTFGFHLATLDVRQDALVHRHAVGQLLGIDDFAQQSPEARVRLITRALGTDQLAPPGDGEELRRSLAVFRAIQEGRAKLGPRAIGPFIISMSQGPDDALAVLLLA
ncbi:MAG: phosphoenolpyruvate carboxylase, partial [Polyangiaceae bacterium]|nr:phosphoenolpyruvate carboxylase [Polyangiaceae bacterium]